jgi:hypothetical protein
MSVSCKRNKGVRSSRYPFVKHLALFLGLTISVWGFTIYPSGHLATSVSLDETYLDFSHYTLHARGLIELTPEAHAELGVNYLPGEPISPIAWIDYTFLEALRIQVGRFPIPFGVFNELANPVNNPLVTIPEICTDAIPTPWFDWGARIQWMQNLNDWETFSLSGYLCNGLGDGEDLRDSRQLSDNNNSNSFGARLALISTRFGEFGASGYFGARDNEGNQNLGLVGFDLNTSISIVELRGEYVAGLLSFEKGAINALGDAVDYLTHSSDAPYQSWTCGTYFQAAFHISQYAIPALRMDIIGYEDLSAGERISKRRLGLGFACYPVKPLVLKFEVGLLDDRNAEPPLSLEPLHLQLGVSL